MLLYIKAPSLILNFPAKALQLRFFPSYFSPQLFSKTSFQ